MPNSVEREKWRVVLLLYLVFILLAIGCKNQQEDIEISAYNLPFNMLDYRGTPTKVSDRSSLIFSDQGAWFAYGFSDSKKAGFTGPFLMTQGQGEWSSKMLSELEMLNVETNEKINYSNFQLIQNSYNSHLEQQLKNDQISIDQTLFFPTAHSAIINTEITNVSKKTITIIPSWNGSLFSTGLKINKEGDLITLTTNRSTAKGIIKVGLDELNKTTATDSMYSIALKEVTIQPNETSILTLAQTFIFPEYDLTKEDELLEKVIEEPLRNLGNRIKEKEEQLLMLTDKLDPKWKEEEYKNLLSKTVLTLQNNTRIAAGELKHAGLFPSYHYKWFLGFWAWDSWKHAVALAHYDSELAKEQVRAMYSFQLDNGFIVDCVYRDTTIENHNYRNTKPPLSAWAVWKIFEQDNDIEFIKEIYPKIVKQHNWWYNFRDFDKDGVCEYGSTDGTLVAAKWESGMDNAVRFDSSKMIENSKTIYSLNQESVDLNAYLYAEKLYLMNMVKVLNLTNEVDNYKTEANTLKSKIQSQFFDSKTGWFYDTSIDGKSFIKVMGCEGWIPLWAKVANDQQAEAVKENMMNPKLFNTKVPLQTLSANHPSFKPNRGYWRGPNWIDQAYFGVRGLHHYNYKEEANKMTYKLLHNAEGVLEKGISIRENYQPITGKGLESKNFSWSAAHYLLLLINE